MFTKAWIRVTYKELNIHLHPLVHNCTHCLSSATKVNQELATGLETITEMPFFSFEYTCYPQNKVLLSILWYQKSTNTEFDRPQMTFPPL